jgi:hypothetical protein
MTTIAFNPAAFRVLYPQFANAGTYPDVMLNDWWATATSIVSADDYGCLVLTGTKRVQALNLLTAHIGTLFQRIQAGETMPVMPQSATIDKTAVTLTPPPTKTQFQWWLSLTGYGAQVLMLLQVAAVGGFYAGVGYPERAAFRKAGGFF